MGQNIQVLISNTPNKDIEFCWIPAHVGILGNELVDTHAKNSINKATIDKIPKIPNQFTKFVQNMINQKWNNDWTNLTNNKLREIKKSVNKWSVNLASKKDMVVITRLRIGHTMLTHGHIINREPRPDCQICQTQ